MDSLLFVAILTLAAVLALALASWLISRWRVRRRAREAEIAAASSAYADAMREKHFPRGAVQEMTPDRMRANSVAAGVVASNRVGQRVDMARVQRSSGRLAPANLAESNSPAPLAPGNDVLAGYGFEINAVQDMRAMEQAAAKTDDFTPGGGDFGGGGASGTWDSGPSTTDMTASSPDPAPSNTDF